MLLQPLQVRTKPAVDIEVYTSTPVEQDAFIEQQHPLTGIVRAVGAWADPSLSVHDALPRNIACIGQRRQRVADGTRITAPDDRGNLPVCCDTPTRDLPDHGIDAFVERHGRRGLATLH